MKLNCIVFQSRTGSKRAYNQSRYVDPPVPVSGVSPNKQNIQSTEQLQLNGKFRLWFLSPDISYHIIFIYSFQTAFMTVLTVCYKSSEYHSHHKVYWLKFNHNSWSPSLHVTINIIYWPCVLWNFLCSLNHWTLSIWIYTGKCLNSDQELVHPGITLIWKDHG